MVVEAFGSCEGILLCETLFGLILRLRAFIGPEILAVVIIPTIKEEDMPTDMTKRIILISNITIITKYFVRLFTSISICLIKNMCNYVSISQIISSYARRIVGT
mmetsp:Transcript_120875/g.341774  ORF Transcript_120875/g.341774 Transcript_120875/m.341774 type:complete len:104 (+) Transcript_120875:141-452(+)